MKPQLNELQMDILQLLDRPVGKAISTGDPERDLLRRLSRALGVKVEDVQAALNGANGFASLVRSKLVELTKFEHSKVLRRIGITDRGRELLAELANAKPPTEPVDVVRELTGQAATAAELDEIQQDREASATMPFGDPTSWAAAGAATFVAAERLPFNEAQPGEVGVVQQLLEEPVDVDTMVKTLLNERRDLRKLVLKLQQENNSLIADLAEARQLLTEAQPRLVAYDTLELLKGADD